MGAKSTERGRRLSRGPHFLRGEGEFLLKLERELARLKRNGGALSLLLTGLVPGKPSANSNDTAMLAQALTRHLEICDSLCPLSPSRYALLLPGQGQLRARRLAEAIQAELGHEAGSGSGKPSFAILNLLQGERADAGNLLSRAKLALERAFSVPGQILQESSFAHGEKDTLVHSGEKQFLFFGAEKK